MLKAGIEVDLSVEGEKTNPPRSSRWVLVSSGSGCKVGSTPSSSLTVFQRVKKVVKCCGKFTTSCNKI